MLWLDVLVSPITTLRAAVFPEVAFHRYHEFRFRLDAPNGISRSSHSDPPGVGTQPGKDDPQRLKVAAENALHRWHFFRQG